MPFPNFNILRQGLKRPACSAQSDPAPASRRYLICPRSFERLEFLYARALDYHLRSNQQAYQAPEQKMELLYERAILTALLARSVLFHDELAVELSVMYGSLFSHEEFAQAWLIVGGYVDAAGAKDAD